MHLLWLPPRSLIERIPLGDFHREQRQPPVAPPLCLNSSVSIVFKGMGSHSLLSGWLKLPVVPVPSSFSLPTLLALLVTLFPSGNKEDPGITVSIDSPASHVAHVIRMWAARV